MGGFAKKLLKSGPASEKDPVLKGAEKLGLPSPGEASRQLSGISAAEAALEAARLQEELGREALTEQEQAQLRLEETLRPFVQLGLDVLPQFQAAFQPTTADAMGGTVTDLTRLADQSILSNPALAKASPEILERSRLVSGLPALSQERQDLLNLLRMSQASAAQQAAGQLETGAGMSDLLTQIGNVQAAGGIGASQARQAGAQNIIGGLGTVLGAIRR